MFARRAQREADRIRALLRDATVPVEAAVLVSTERDEEILARVLTSASASPAVHGPRRGLARPSVMRVAIAAVAVVAVVVGAVGWQAWRATPADAHTPAELRFSDSDAAAVLADKGAPAHDEMLRLAAIAGAVPTEPGHGDQVVSSYGWYLDASVDENGTATTVLAPMYSTTVLRPDGSFSNREIRAPALDVHGRVVNGEYPPGGQTSGDDLPAGTFDANQVANLPRDPVALRQTLLTVSTGGATDLDERTQAGVLVQAVTALYGQYVVPPDLAAALWTMMADEPRLVTLGKTTDRLGRDGVAVAVSDGQPDLPATTILVISPDDGHLLEWDHMVKSMPQLGIDQPAVTAFQAFLSSTWVAEKQ